MLPVVTVGLSNKGSPVAEPSGGSFPRLCALRGIAVSCRTLTAAVSKTLHGRASSADRDSAGPSLISWALCRRIKFCLKNRR